MISSGNLTDSKINVVGMFSILVGKSIFCSQDTATESLSTTTVQTDTDITIDDIEQSKSLNEVALREAQVVHYYSTGSTLL